MPVRKPILLTVAALAIAISSPASAKTIFASGDWSLDDSQPGVQGKGNCVAATATYLGNYGAYSLNLILDKSGTHPLELMIRPFKSPSNVASFTITVNSGRAYFFVKLPRTAKGEDTFWNLPRGTEKLITELKTSTQLNVISTNGMGDLPLSMSGASAVLTELEKRCVASPAMNSADFEKTFLPQEVNNVDFSKLDPAKHSLIRDTVTKGADAYRNIDKMNAELAALEVRFAKLNEEKATITSTIDLLANRDLPALGSARNAAQSAIDKANAEIASLKSSITTQEALITSAQAANDSASAKIKPYLPEHQRLLGLNQNDDQRKTNSESALSGAEQAVSSKTQELADRTAESGDLRQRISRIIEESRQERSRLASATSAMHSFDPSIVIRRRRDADRHLGGLENEIRVLTQNVRASEQAVAAAEADRLEAARQALAQVQNQLQAKVAERDGISHQIEQEVTAQRDEIVRQEAEGRRAVADLESRRDQMDSRVRDLNQYVIPNLQTELSSLNAQRLARSNELNFARSALAKSTEALRAYEASVKFTALNNEVQKTAGRVSAIKQEITSLKAGVADRQQLVLDQTALRDGLIKKIASTNETIAQKNARQVEVNQALLPYATDRKAADGKIEAARKVLADISQELAAQLPQTAKR
jgi:chromosome segregation ATPase